MCTQGSSHHAELTENVLPVVCPSPLQQQLRFHLHPPEPTQVPSTGTQHTAADNAQAPHSECSVPSHQHSDCKKQRERCCWGKGGVQGMFCAASEPLQPFQSSCYSPALLCLQLFSLGPEQEAARTWLRCQSCAGPWRSGCSQRDALLHKLPLSLPVPLVPL